MFVEGVPTRRSHAQEPSQAETQVKKRETCTSPPTRYRASHGSTESRRETTNRRSHIPRVLHHNRAGPVDLDQTLDLDHELRSLHPGVQQHVGLRADGLLALPLLLRPARIALAYFARRNVLHHVSLQRDVTGACRGRSRCYLNPKPSAVRCSATTCGPARPLGHWKGFDVFASYLSWPAVQGSLAEKQFGERVEQTPTCCSILKPFVTTNRSRRQGGHSLRYSS